MTASRLALITALAVLGLLAAVTIPRLSVATDMSFFMPGDPAPEVAALSNGMAQAGSLIMVGLDGPDTAALAEASDTLTRRLRGRPGIIAVANGRPHLPADLRAFVVDHRYLLGPATAPESFSPETLRAALETAPARLATVQGWLLRDLFPRDPVGRLDALTDLLAWDGGPPRQHGVWMDDGRALVLLRLRAAAGDLDAQAAARSAVAEAASSFAEAGITWVASGPGLFGVEASERIRGEMQELTLLASVLVALLLLAAFRTPVMLVLVALPVGFGLLVGVALTQAVFGQVHGVAITFGAVLVGVAADYPIHLAGLRRATESPGAAARRLGRPLFLGAATTVAGLLALSQSSFPGLAQIGTLSAAAMVTAAAVSRWLLPHVMPARPLPLRLSDGPWRLLRARPGLRRGGRLVAGGAVGLAVVTAWVSPTPLWDTDLSRLSIALEARKALDHDLRQGLRLPDTNRLLLVEGDDAEAVLAAQMALLPALDQAVAAGRLGGYRATASVLPPVAVQVARQAALPDAATLAARLDDAAQGLPLRAAVLAPFIADVAHQKTAVPLRPTDIATSPAAGLVPLPWPISDGWAGVIPLVPPLNLDTAALPGAALVDLPAVAAAMVKDYRLEALRWLGFGSLAALFTLAVVLRRPRALLRAVLPATGAVVVTGAVLVALGIPLTMFHILALLLVASIGVDYALFFTGYSGDEGRGADSVKSIALCSATTITVFTVLGFSALPVLNAIGTTVAIGSAASLALTIFSLEN